MIRLGMTIPTLPGRSRRPRNQHPGARNIERENKKDEINIPKKSPLPKEKPSAPPTSKIPFITNIIRRKPQGK
jgi:hypothetical protein